MSAFGTSRNFAASQNLVAIGGIADIGCDWDWMLGSDQSGHHSKRIRGPFSRFLRQDTMLCAEGQQ